MTGKEKRFDIQVMRGVAVLAVVVFHAVNVALPKGFLGVDVFFVISGFLITGMILRQLEEKRFSFIGFYARRARRLLPASLVTVAVTAAIAAVILVRADYAAFAKQVFGAITFTANFAVAQQTGYFDTAAKAKPLLHLWSLSLEEQFYFLAPLLLWLTPLRARPWLLGLGILASIALCFWGGSAWFLPEKIRILAVTIAYFMLPSRAWELLIGGLAAWAMLRRPDMRVAGWLKYVSLAAILFTLVIGVSNKHPGPDALIVSIATAVILMGRDDWLGANVLSRAVARVGDWSYSLYLVHWPLFSFAFVLYVGEPPVVVLAALGVLAIFLGWAQYRYVEQVFLNKVTMPTRRIWPILLGATIALAIAAGAFRHYDRQDPNLAAISGLAMDCSKIGAAECRTGENPTVLLWGDSHAMHLVPGLQAELGSAYPMMQVTQHGCVPAVGLLPPSQTGSPEGAIACRKFNADVVAALPTLPSVKAVIVSGAYDNVFFEGDLPKDGHLGPLAASALSHMRETLAAIQSAGKTAILVGPTPRGDFDFGACSARLVTGRWVLGRSGCDIPRAGVMASIDAMDGALAKLARDMHVTYLRPIPTLCDDTRCPHVRDGVSVYRDNSHVTITASQRLMRDLGVRKLLDGLAAQPGATPR